MTRAATITEIEHKIEALPPTDQLKLLERIVRHLKHSFTDQPPAKQRKVAVAGDAVPLRGAFKQYAAPELRERESGAFAQAMKEKHALR
jgi:predicted NBD/HSP70 family sugar kinase